MTHTTVNLALDPGFGGFKTGLINGDGLTTHVTKAVVGAGTLGNDNLSTGLGRGKAPDKPHAVRFDQVNYLVGENVHRHTRPIERLDFSRLSDGPELKALVYAALYNALGPGEHHINLLAGLPVQVLQDTSLAASARAQLRGWLAGEHHYSVDGDLLNVTAHQVKAMPQPLGSFFYWGMDSRGQWIQPDDPQAKFAIGDLGFNTLDCFVIEGARVNDRYSGGDTLGMRRACSLLKSTVRDQYGVTISLQEADSFLRDTRPVLHHSQGSTDLAPLANQALDNAFGGVASYLEETWGNGKQFRRLIFTGGGAEALKNRLTALYPHAIVLPDAQTANAGGLAKFAQRKQVFK